MESRRASWRPLLAALRLVLQRCYTLVVPSFTVSASLLVGLSGLAQEALRDSIAGDAAVEAQHQRMMSQPWNIKKGDFRLAVTPSFGLSWNDNINLSHSDPLTDFILSPNVLLDASYPITAVNLLTLSVGVGYDQYLEHNNYSGLRLTSGSALAFDIYVKDFKIDLHDRFSVSQSSAGQASVANIGPYGAFQNAAGITVDWDLQDVTVTLGYDHQNYIPVSSSLSYETSATESVLPRVGFQLNPTLTVGIEGTASFTTYDQRVLNDNQGYSGGVFADWRPGKSGLTIAPRAGYSIYQFQQTSLTIPAKNQSAWYADLTASHAITDWITYSLSAGHELRLGLQADSIEDTYFRPAIHWNIIKNLAIDTSFSFEHGTQSASRLIGTGAETYDLLTGTVGLSHPLIKKVSVGLSYRFTIRASNFTPREYTQDVVSLTLTYRPE